MIKKQRLILVFLCLSARSLTLTYSVVGLLTGRVAMVTRLTHSVTRRPSLGRGHRGDRPLARPAGGRRLVPGSLRPTGSSFVQGSRPIAVHLNDAGLYHGFQFHVLGVADDNTEYYITCVTLSSKPNKLCIIAHPYKHSK